MADPLAAAPAPAAQTRPATIAATPTHVAPQPPGPPLGGQPGRDPAAPAVPTVSPDAAARSRMHECGHQWSTLKKTGNVGTMTWKDFSATCLVVSK